MMTDIVGGDAIHVYIMQNEIDNTLLFSFGTSKFFRVCLVFCVLKLLPHTYLPLLLTAD